MAQRHYQRGREPTEEEKERLRKAIERNDTDTIHRMIQKDSIDINADIIPRENPQKTNWLPWLQQKQYTALHYAVQHNKLQCVKLLTQLGADVTKTDKDRDDITKDWNNKTPLQRAIDKNHSSIVYYLVKEYNQDISTLDQGYQLRILVIMLQYEREWHKQVTQLRDEVEQLTVNTKSNDQGAQLFALQQGLTNEQQNSAALERRCQSLETRCQSLESSLAAEKQKSQSLEERIRTVEDTVERLWAISRDEINLSNKMLGTGGWGYVTEATFRGRRVAAKCLHEAIISPHNQEVFAKEMKISARCRHKNLVEFIGAVPDHPAIIVIEMMDCTLRFALSNRRVIPNHIHSICIDVADGLVYLHSIQPHPLIHRDVSAPNVLLKAVGAGWVAKLSDLGSAQFANIAQTLAPGCVLYAAPEVQQRDTALKQTEKVDVYSYGVLLIEILTREMPTGILSQLINSLQPTRPQFIPLIQRCTNIDPTRRPTMRDVISSLNTINI